MEVCSIKTDDMDTLLVETINSNLIFPFKLADMDNIPSHFVIMEQLPSMVLQIGGNVILELAFLISMMLRFLPMLASLANSWLSLVLKRFGHEDAQKTSKME
jgi:hypothetical protein